MMIKRNERVLFMSRKKRKIQTMVVTFFCCIVVSGCSVTDLAEGKRQDLEFTVIRKEELPEELKETIDEKKANPFRITYTDKGKMYIARGYGEQKTSGYSIQVTDVYEAGKAVHIRTVLEGPGEKEKVTEKKTYPYVAVKLDYYDKQVVFEE